MAGILRVLKEEVLGKVAHPRGFTLVELLVVVVIIAILAAVLFPVYQTAKQNAQSTKCLAHEQELMAALLMYTQDWGGRLPFIQFLSCTDWAGTAAGRPDLGVTRLYEPYVHNFEIILCPADMAYAYNQCLYCPPSAKATYKGPRWEVYYDGAASHRCGRLLNEVRRPGRCPAFFCAKRMPGKKGRRDTPFELKDNGWGWVPSDIYVSDYMPNKHNNGANYAFLDGHCQWRPPAGNGFFMAVEGIDYDGNGSLGQGYCMR